MNTNTPTGLMETTTPKATAKPDPIEAKRNAIPIAAISLGLLCTLAWNGLIIFGIGRLLRLW
jgi:hypothetical protein